MSMMWIPRDQINEVIAHVLPTQYKDTHRDENLEISAEDFRLELVLIHQDGSERESHNIA
jgi:hypothetical protein